MADGNPHYPGSETEPGAILLLANQYRLAFQVLLKPSTGKRKWVSAPARLCAIHSVELYLQAVLRCDGISSAEIRSKPHKLRDLAAYPVVAGLKLRKKTRDHLDAMTDSREYLLVRYAPDEREGRSELNRIEATLEELATKAGKHLDRVNAATRPNGS